MDSVARKGRLRWRGLALGIAVFFCVFATQLAAVQPAEAKYASIVVNALTGEVLRSRNGDVQRYPASLTKLMTLYLLFEAVETGRLTLESRLKVSRRAARQPASRLGLAAGATIRVEDAIHALIIRSANDVAVVAAEALGGSEKKFAVLMTKKARALGMSRTTFRNASGLPNRAQRSTARDMARLARAILQHFPHRYDYFGKKVWRYRNTTYRSHNRLIGGYPGVDGMKTGYIRASGFNLVASARRDGRRIIAVVFGGKTARSRNAHMMGLLDTGFKRLAALDAKRGWIAGVPKPVFKFYPTVVTRAAAEGAHASAAPAPTGRERGSGGAWGIQVGAYATVEAAESALQAASRRAGSRLDDAAPALARHRSDRGTFYRARFVGMERNEASRACAALETPALPCMVIRTLELPPVVPAGARRS